VISNLLKLILQRVLEQGRQLTKTKYSQKVVPLLLIIEMDISEKVIQTASIQLRENDECSRDRSMFMETVYYNEQAFLKTMSKIKIFLVKSLILMWVTELFNFTGSMTPRLRLSY